MSRLVGRKPTGHKRDPKVAFLHGIDKRDRDRGKTFSKTIDDSLKADLLEAGALQPPAWVEKDDNLLEHFLEMRDVAIQNGVAAVTDIVSLRMLCIQYAQYIRVCEILDEQGMVVESVNAKTGIETTKQHPLLSERSRLFTTVRMLMAEFGLTPSTRRTVKAEPPPSDPEDKKVDPEEEEWAEILRA